MSNERQLDSTLFDEELVAVGELPRLLPPTAGGARLHRGAVWRWVTKGLEAPDGSRVYLEALRMGRRWVTSKQAVGRFFRRRSGAERGSGGPAAAAAPATRSDPATVATLKRFGLTVPGVGSSS